MSGRVWTCLFLSVLLPIALWLAIFFSHRSEQPEPVVRNSLVSASKTNTAPLYRPTALASGSTEPGWRLSNTLVPLNQLAATESAILLENASLDTDLPLDLPIPPALRAQRDPGAYIVQTTTTDAARLAPLLSRFDAKLISYIPNNAWLVRIAASDLSQLAQSPGIRAVLPYHPYFKLKPSLLPLALDPPSAQLELNVLLFPSPSPISETIAGLPPDVRLRDRQRSPFGPLLKISCSASSLAALAASPGVAAIEPAGSRVPTTDLARESTGVAANSTVPHNYLGLTGSNVVVGLADTGVDHAHPDLTNRVFFGTAALGDSLGHGTLVAGIIAGSGAGSTLVSNVQGSVMLPVPFQFRGMAPDATLFAINVKLDDPLLPDSALQEAFARTNVLIANNSWVYKESTAYDLSAASFDAAVRDALPTQSGPQPVVFLFSAGNNGSGLENGTGGNPDSIQSPATAKNVITVGATEQLRQITNIVCGSEPSWLVASDSSNQVASFSGRGNVGIGVEGEFGRIKPDVVAPGGFILAPRAADWDSARYYDPTNFPMCPEQGQALSNLNESVGPLYRYESGTSLAAGAAAGTLALIQQFFAEHMQRTNSPALLKALLINGARPVTGPAHCSTTNLQGWGLVQLPNSLPAGLTNSVAAPMLFFDQEPSRALATGQSFAQTISVSEAARAFPLRLTLVWTDPPGNPVAGIKLVNDLDLVVTNLETGEVFVGNDLDQDTGFSRPQTNSTLGRDFVNNVENVFLPSDFTSNYAVTVVAHRVNVNAAYSATASVAQDFALVISSGEGQTADALQILEEPSSADISPSLTVLTDTLTGEDQIGSFARAQRIGEQPPATDPAAPIPGTTNQFVWIGSTNQWKFFVLTNTAGFSNAAFFTFSADPLATGPFVPGETNKNLGRDEADIDLYVSTNGSLLHLDPDALSASHTSQQRGSLESVLITDAEPGPYYIAVKCESRGGAVFDFFGVFTEFPLTFDEYPSAQLLRGVPVSIAIPGGSPSAPGEGEILAVAPGPGLLRRLVVSNTFDSPRLGDVSATLRHNETSVLLKAFSDDGPATNQTIVFDDSLELSLPSFAQSSGPGSLRDFCGKPVAGPWLFSLATTNSAVTSQDLVLSAEYQQDLSFGSMIDLLPGACRDEYVVLPLEATNLTLSFDLSAGAGPVEIQISPVDAPPEYGQELLLDPAASNLVVVVDAVSNPPLAPGNYRVRMCNTGTESIQLHLSAGFSSGAFSPAPVEVTKHPCAPIPDDAVSFSSLTVTNGGPIFSVDVGLRIKHPRVSDLAISVVSPQGTRALLFENRGAGSTNGLGTEALVTNIVPVSSSGGPQAYTNSLNIGRSSGELQIDYDFYGLPDSMRVYYENTLLFDSGLISGSGSTNLGFGPGTSTMVTIVMNEGDNYDPDTAWFYTVSSSRTETRCLTFTENTNLAQAPIKFALPPFDRPADADAEGIYYLPETSLGRFKGEVSTGDWTLEIRDTHAGGTNPVPILDSWRLAFIHGNPKAVPIRLEHDSPLTNRLNSGFTQWFSIEAPAWADFATNTLLWSSLPVNLFFNSSTPPSGTNQGDALLVGGALWAVITLETNSSPALVPGATYYLGLQNTNDTPVDFAFQIDFNVTPLQEGISVTDPSGRIARYFSYEVSSNATAVEFQLFDMAGNADLVLSRELPFPTAGDCLVGSFNPGTDSESIILFSGSSPVPLAPGNWFIGVVGPSNVGSYTLKVDEYTNDWPYITDLYSGIPYTPFSGQSGEADYYRFLVATNSVRAQFEVINPSAEVALVLRRGLPLPDASSFDFISANPGTNDELIIVSRGDSPIPLESGEWFLSVLDLSGGNAEYAVQATEFFSVPSARFVGWEVANDSFCLSWPSVPGAHYFVQGVESLNDTNWVSVSGTLTALDSITSWCVPLPSPYHFFRLQEGIVVTPPFSEPDIRSIVPATNGFLLQWTAPTNHRFQVQWTDCASPSDWLTFSNTVTSATGLFMFLDDGSQSGGIGPTRFYRFFRNP